MWSRLCERLKTHKAAGTSVEMEEEFRILTLQIIAEAFLSLPPEESDRVRSGKQPYSNTPLPILLCCRHVLLLAGIVAHL